MNDAHGECPGTLATVLQAAAGYRPTRAYLDDFGSAGLGFLPDSILAPVREVLERPELQEILARPQARAARTVVAELAGHHDDGFLATELRSGLLRSIHRFHGAGAAPPCEQPRLPPRLDGVRAYVHGQEICCPVPGDAVETLRAGMLVTLVGEHFSPVASHNVVRIDGQRLPVAGATGTTLTVCIAPPVDVSGKKARWARGRVELAVTTPAGTARLTASLEGLEPAGEAERGDLADLIAETRQLFGLAADRVGHARAHLGPLERDDATGTARELLTGAGPLLGVAARRLEAIDAGLRLLDEAGEDEVTPTLDAMVRNSGLLPALRQLRAGLDDPTVAFLRGSGFVEWFCTFTKWVWMVVLFLVALLVVIALIVGFMVILGPKGWVMIVVLVLIAKLLILAIKAMIAVAVVTTILYVIIKFFEWAFGSGPEG